MTKFLRLSNYIISCVLLLLCNTLSAQEKRIDDNIYIKGATIRPVPNVAHWLDSTAQSHETAQVLISFTALPSVTDKSTLAKNGITLLNYIPNNAYVALVKLPVSSGIAQLVSTLYSITNIQPLWKASDYLWQQINSHKSDNVTILASFYNNIDTTLIRQVIEQAGGIILPNNLQQFGYYKINIPAAKATTLAQWYGLQYINPVTQNKPLDVVAKANSKVNLIQANFTAGAEGLLGDSVTVGVGDNTSGIYHIDLRDRIINYNPAAISHHGIHINGIIGSAGIVDPLAAGMAPHATLVNHLYDNILATALVMHQSHDMTITNNSYVVADGDCGYEGTYDSYSQFVDQLALQDKNILHVFAAGNDGYLTCSPYPPGFATVCGGYQPAKNALVVSSNDKYYDNAWDASKGPVKDGRLKPDMVAVGFNVYSDIDDTSYEFASGTSMASPEVAGASALLTQRYKQLYNTEPASDVLKTILLDGAEDIGNPGPDYRYGFGLLNMHHSMQMLENQQFDANTISNGGLQTQTINVPANTAQLKVMLYWNDVPASPLATTELVNDLDLTVTTPASVVHKPLVLDPSPTSFNNNAVEGDDHLNNCEQVIINNPATGAYTVNVKGYNIPSGNQPYVVAYDFIPKGIQVTFPNTGAQIATDTPTVIYWEASDDTNPFTLDYSTDNGTSWNTIDNNISAQQRFYIWKPSAGISSGKCLIRLIRNNTSGQSVSGRFIISPQPIVQLSSVQCPGYININWQAIPNAIGYQVVRKKGPYMEIIDTALSTNYNFSGLSVDSTYYVAVSPIIDGLVGYRSIAAIRKPDNGNCAGGFSNGDLMLEKIIDPVSGRRFTSSQLSASESLQLQIRNLYTTACSNYSVSYRLSGGVWQIVSGLPALPANSATTITIPAGLNLSTAGIYYIEVAVTNSAVTDPVQSNDTLVKRVLNIPNAPINLTSGFTDSFETMVNAPILHDSIGISPNGHWDFENPTDSGRLRTFVDDSILISGNRSVSLDAIQTVIDNQNYFTGTFNLGNYNPNTTEVRMQFDYVLHGKPKFSNGNQVWVRGNDTQPWQSIYYYDTLATAVGMLKNSGTLSISDALRNSSQSFSGSTQIRFGQHDTAVIATRNYGNGLTIDNFKIYTVQNDVQLLKIVSPTESECGLNSSVPLTVLVYNGVNQAQHNVRLFYQLNNGAVIADTLTIIAPKDTVAFTFSVPMSSFPLGTDTINTWLVNNGDTYHQNDSILNYVVHNQQLITSFPYLQTFENGTQSWYTTGINDSWQFGTPASPKIRKAASGIHAWKTNLTGNYNNLETSYLYSPCFDISGMAHPMLSFSMAMDIENCGSTLCDAAYMEYSYDGVVWTKLGAAGQGTNWYDSSFNVWNEQGNPRWHVASIPLPVSTQPIRFRFVLASDPGATFEGLAIDDIHIFDLKNSIYSGSMPQQISQNIPANQWVNYIANNQIVAQVQSASALSGQVSATVYNHTIDNTNLDSTQYIFPRSFTVKPVTGKISQPASVRLYVLDSEVVQLINDSNCLSCTKPEDAYSLGITQYDDANTSLENGSLADNFDGTYKYYSAKSLLWVPYDKGYYTTISVDSLSEFWLNDGGPEHNTSVGDSYLLFDAQKMNEQNVKASWTSYIDTGVSIYELQRAYILDSFYTIRNISALHSSPSVVYQYIDTPTVNIGSSVYYRLKWTMNDGRIFYSPIRRVDWTNADQLISVYPNPTNGILNIKWTAHIGTHLLLALYDVSGRLAYKTDITATEWNNITTLQTPHFQAGIYIMRIDIAGKKYNEKILYK